MIKYTIVIYISLLFGLASPSWAQKTTYVFLESNMAEAFVFADSVYMGKASQGEYQIDWAASELRVVPPQLDSWAISSLKEDISNFKGDSLYLNLNFPYYYNVESIPYDARVFVEKQQERILLGSTPLLYKSNDPLRGMLLITKEGYEPQRLSPGEDIWNNHRLEMVPNSVGEELAETFWYPETRSNKWIDYVAGGVALASGILSIHYKTKANRRYNVYEENGDPALRSGFERYDRYAAYALGTMQVGIGVLAVRFIIN